ncbi:MAG: PAS domain S-box protein [Planctomycetes bacterium]|nr:PAS domain S-box protein [Planctomycetota bacterium]
MPTSEDLRAEIERTLGFFPAFITSSLDSPEDLERIWRAGLSASLRDPLPPLLKQRLLASLASLASIARYCGPPSGPVLEAQPRPSPGRTHDEGAYRDLVENAADLILRLDPGGRILFANRRSKPLLGYVPEDLRGLAVAELVHPDAKAPFAAALSRVLAGAPVVRLETSLLTWDGRGVPLDGALTCSDAADAPRALTAVFRDLTDRREVEQRRDEFLSTVSHELRTPLASVQVSLNLLALETQGSLSLRARAVVLVAHRNCARLGRLLNDILLFERMRTGRLSFQLRPVSLAAVVEEAVDAERPEACRKGVGLLIEYPLPDVEVRVDPGRLGQALGNLLTNAVRFSPTGTTVRVEVSRAGGPVRVSVTDEGPGIPPELRDRVFERFTRASGSGATDRGGAGLGLSIVKGILERLGGQVGFTKPPGSGTTFYFELPEWLPEGTSTVTPPAEDARGAVLVYQPEPQVATVLGLWLARAGYRVDIATDALEAGPLMRRNRYAAVALDLSSAREETATVLREVRASATPPQDLLLGVRARARPVGRPGGGAGLLVAAWRHAPPDPAALLAAITEEAGAATVPVCLAETEAERQSLDFARSTLQRLALRACPVPTLEKAQACALPEPLAPPESLVPPESLAPPESLVPPEPLVPSEPLVPQPDGRFQLVISELPVPESAAQTSAPSEAADPVIVPPGSSPFRVRVLVLSARKGVPERSLPLAVTVSSSSLSDAAWVTLLRSLIGGGRAPQRREEGEP